MPQRFVVLPCDTGAVGWYRLIGPAVMAQRAGAPVALAPTPTAADLADPGAVFVVQRERTALPDIEAIPDARLLVETDDDLAGIPPESPAYGVVGPGSPVPKRFLAALRRARGATVSTPELAAVCAPHQPRIELLPNVVDFPLRDWSPPQRGADPAAVVVGWAGGATHVADLELVRPVLRRVLQARPAVQLAIYSTPGILRWIEREWRVDPQRLVAIPYRPFGEFPAGLDRFDIGIAPLRGTPFDRCKSGLKALEYGAKRIAVVASRVEPYARVVDDGVDGFLAADGAEWEARLLQLADDPARRSALGGALAAKVERDHNLTTAWPRWLEAWRRLAGGA